MKTHLKILSLFIVFRGVMMRSGNVYKGTVGQRVDIQCNFSDEHKYTPKYFCREPCTSSNVLIKIVKIDEVVSAGRYSVIYNPHSKTFTVTIKHLKLSDSGVYYCGLDQWFLDGLIKVQLSVHPAPVIPPLNTSASTLSSTHTTKHTVTTHTSADSASSTPTVHSSSATPRAENLVDMSVVYAGVLLLLVFCFLVALVLLCKKRSLSKSRSLNPPILGNPLLHPPNLNQTEDDVFHVYDKVTTEHCLVAQPQENDASFNVSPKDDVNALYSLITLQQM